MFAFILCIGFGLILHFGLVRPVLYRAGWI
jgi:hypothetical protein